MYPLYSYHHILPLLSIPELLADNWGRLVIALIVIFGLFVLGAGDLTRFSFKRVWAISGVCFDESIRKRVLWITPLAIVGVIGITQFQRAFDEQDAVRQSLKVCLFATAVVVMLASMILACTNLPKEIESRVIYTIVTKPVTRLELVLGKVMGFSRVALAIVIIMGLFTWAYMRFSAHQKRQQIAYRLQEGDVSDTERGRLNEYQQTGLLTARSLWAPDELGMYRRAARSPQSAAHHQQRGGPGFDRRLSRRPRCPVRPAQRRPARLGPPGHRPKRLGHTRRPQHRSHRRAQRSAPAAQVLGPAFGSTQPKDFFPPSWPCKSSMKTTSTCSWAI